MTKKEMNKLRALVSKWDLKSDERHITQAEFAKLCAAGELQRLLDTLEVDECPCGGDGYFTRQTGPYGPIQRIKCEDCNGTGKVEE